MIEPSYDVLSPWSETDPLPLQGITPRLSEPPAKRIGMFMNNKVAAPPIQDAVESELRARYGAEITLSRFRRLEGGDAGSNSDDGPRYTRWLEDVDAVIVAVGD